MSERGGHLGSDAWFLTEATDDPDWSAKRRLAAAVRRLVNGTTTVEAPAEALSALAERLEAEAERLDALPHETFAEAFALGRYRSEARRLADRNPLIGWSNPVAPPIRLSEEGELSVAEVTFGSAYEGAPGFVHGGYVAAAMDQLMGFAVLRLKRGALTGSLTIRYLKPTPVRSPLRFECSIGETEERRTHVGGRVLHGEQTVAESDGIFISVERKHMQKLFGHTEDSGER